MLIGLLKKLVHKTGVLLRTYGTRLLLILLSMPVVLYLYGMLVNFCAGRGMVFPPTQNWSAAFTPAGIGVLIIGIVLLLLCRSPGILSRGKSLKDKERRYEILPEGTHGTSHWMEKRRAKEVLAVGSLEDMEASVFGRLPSGPYVGMKEQKGMSRNIMVYGPPGSFKSRGFAMPFIMQAVRRQESLVICDSKAEFYETYSAYLQESGYLVRSFNLLDMQASDAWNCIMDAADHPNLVQVIADTIIRNTSADSERDDFWSKAEANLLMALLHYVRTLTYPQSDKLLPPEDRSLGAIYRLIATTSVNELDACFRTLPPGHPALPPYGIFRQAPRNIHGNIMIGLGSRLAVLQDSFVNSITSHHEIDLEEPGRRKCAYFCVISDQDDTYRFLSSLFFSLLFVRLFDFARQSEERRLPVRVNVLMDEFCNILLPNSKKYLSVSRSRNIDIQCIVQSVSQLADRYPKTEWQELVGDCDYQLLTGCNDWMTAEYISKLCGMTTVRVNNISRPLPPLLSPFAPMRPFTENRTSAARPLITPDELRRLPKDQALLLVRGEAPLLLQKIQPEEHPDYTRLRPCKAADHIPAWRLQEEKEENLPTPTVPAATSKLPPEPEEPLLDDQDLAPLDEMPTIPIGRGMDLRQGAPVEISPEDI